MTDAGAAVKTVVTSWRCTCNSKSRRSAFCFIPACASSFCFAIISKHRDFPIDMHNVVFAKVQSECNWDIEMQCTLPPVNYWIWRDNNFRILYCCSLALFKFFKTIDRKCHHLIPWPILWMHSTILPSHTSLDENSLGKVTRAILFFSIDSTHSFVHNTHNLSVHVHLTNLDSDFINYWIIDEIWRDLSAEQLQRQQERGQM